jgi:hypothetical protein
MRKGPGDPGPLLFPPEADGVSMRKPDAAPASAMKPSLPDIRREAACLELVCLALALALVALVLRIATIW